jgi:hypothetical protein
LISHEILGEDFPLFAILAEVMVVCAPAGVNADSTSEKAISRGNQLAILS